MKVNVFGPVSGNGVIEQTSVDINGPAPANHSALGNINTGIIVEEWLEGFE
jgi:hypothetical protein